LYRDTRNAHKTLCLDGKNRAMVCSLRLCTRTLPRLGISAHSLHAQTNTNDTLLPGRYKPLHADSRLLVKSQ
jgi:hypothetical protein